MGFTVTENGEWSIVTLGFPGDIRFPGSEGINTSFDLHSDHDSLERSARIGIVAGICFLAIKSVCAFAVLS
jgi:hypothetical protein